MTPDRKCAHATPADPCGAPVTTEFEAGPATLYVCDRHLPRELGLRERTAAEAASDKGIPANMWETAPDYSSLVRARSEFLNRWALENGHPELVGKGGGPVCSHEGNGPCWGNVRPRSEGATPTCSGHREYPAGPYHAEAARPPVESPLRYLPRRAPLATPELLAMDKELRAELEKKAP